jgi:hypothetical protein
MPFLRFTRDRHGYEHFQLVQPAADRHGTARSRILYWFRSPPNVRVGRKPFDDAVRAALEQENPGVEFDWTQILSTPIPSADAEHWRERRRQERAARQVAAEEEAAQEAAIEQAGFAEGADRAEGADGSPRQPGADENIELAAPAAADSSSNADARTGTQRRNRRRRRRRPSQVAQGGTTSAEPATEAPDRGDDFDE